jgi:dTDP-4-dehydrorhamnose reductase
MRILVTGAGGQLGRALPAALGGHEVVGLDRARLDVTRLEDVRLALAAHGPDLVINAAAYNEVDRAEADPEAAFRGNALGPRNLALSTAERGAALLHVSSDYVFDGQRLSPYHEFVAPAPLSVYGRSKLAGEEAVRALNPRHFLVRTAWVYAAEGRNFPLTMLAAARGRDEVRVVSDQYGSPTWAPHLAQGIARLVGTGAFGTYHLAGRGGTSWFELTQALFRAQGLRTAVRPVSTAEFPRPAPRPRYAVLTTWQDPQILLPPWEEGIEELVRALPQGPP